jgi:hypothetical protein
VRTAKDVKFRDTLNPSPSSRASFPFLKALTPGISVARLKAVKLATIYGTAEAVPFV